MSFPYANHFQDFLENIHLEKRYRVFNPLEKDAHHFPRALSHQHDTANVTLWSTNDYLGLSMAPKAIEAVCAQAKKSGVGAGGTRNISGTHPLHLTLENCLASLHGKEKALLFNSGYAANEWTLYTLGRLLPRCVMFSDAANHASIIMGIRGSGADKHIFQHNDLKNLENLLKDADALRPKVIVCESVYSMDGDFAPLADLCQLAFAHKALLYVDEVHAVGLYGAKGAGLAEAQNVADGIHLLQGTLAKAFGTLGGYVVGDATLIDVIRSYAPGFIFSTAMPSLLLAASLANIEESLTNTKLRADFWQTVAATRLALQKKGLPIVPTPSHIIPLIVGDGAKCEKMAQSLLKDFGIYLQPINYPTVPKGTERFRITPLRGHTPQMIDDLALALDHLWRKA